MRESSVRVGVALVLALCALMVVRTLEGPSQSMREGASTLTQALKKTLTRRVDSTAVAGPRQLLRPVRRSQRLMRVLSGETTNPVLPGHQTISSPGCRETCEPCL